ncbi:MAG: helix-turn-helix domain-containing protein [Christensenellales bacterium]|jgi:transposase
MEMKRITEEEFEKIKAARKANKNKRVEKLLEVLTLRYEGKSNREITERTGYNERYVTTLLAKYRKQGLEEFIRIKQTSHHRKMTEAEEARLLEKCSELADQGKVLSVADIRQVFEEALGEKTASSYIYRVLKRHEWRKVMPRTKHPKAASEEEQNSSKKLTLNTSK